jgi:hypothetical protein
VQVTPILLTLQKNLTKKYEELAKMWVRSFLELGVCSVHGIRGLHCWISSAMWASVDYSEMEETHSLETLGTLCTGLNSVTSQNTVNVC